MTKARFIYLLVLASLFASLFSLLGGALPGLGFSDGGGP